MSFFFGGGEQTFSFFSSGFSWLSWKVPCALQAAENGTGIAHKRDVDAAALLRPSCETALCFDAAALKSLKGPTVLLCEACILLTATRMVEERHAQSCQRSLSNRSETFRVCRVLFQGAEVERHSSPPRLDYKMGLERPLLASGWAIAGRHFPTPTFQMLHERCSAVSLAAFISASLPSNKAFPLTGAGNFSGWAVSHFHVIFLPPRNSSFPLSSGLCMAEEHHHVGSSVPGLLQAWLWGGQNQWQHGCLLMKLCIKSGFSG